MKPPQILGAILAHLRAAGGAVSSRDLAGRFLLIRTADESTCRRLLAPILDDVRGVGHIEGEGWSFDPKAAAAPRDDQPAPVAPSAHVDPPDRDSSEDGGSLLDIVALAVDGVGPGGSGAPRALTYLPVIGGEELQEDHLPSWGLDSDGVVVGDDEGVRAGLTGAQARGGLEVADLEALAEAVGDLPIVVHRAAREAEPIVRAAADAGLPFHPRVVSAARLGHLLLGLKANHAALELAAALGVEAPGPDDCRGRARLVARSFLRLVPMLEAKGITTVDGLLEFQGMPAPPLDLSGYAFTADDLKAIPAAPGIYRFLDRQGAAIYIGKARNLRVRVASYFVPGARGTAKGRAILGQVFRIETQTVGSELEANLLEAALLAEHRPPLNRQFEVHERPAPYGPRLNLVVVLRDAEGPACTLHLLRGGRYLKRMPGITSASDAPALHEAVDAGYFRGAGERQDEMEIDWPIVSSYLRRYHDEVSVLDVDECASPAEASDRLAVLVRAALAGAGKIVAR
jgi:GIY-YIG catalytic domain